MVNTSVDSFLCLFHVASQRHVMEKKANGQNNDVMMFHILTFSGGQE